VTDGDECADILMLLAAIRGGINSLMAEILEDHIRLHITHPDRGNRIEQRIDRRSDWSGARISEVGLMTGK
jgi:DNA-binding FrmR family transcriptional regulator